MKKYLIPLMIILLCSGCNDNYTSDEKISAGNLVVPATQNKDRSLLIGKWYGNQPLKEGGFRQSITERAVDGTYRTIFRIYDADGQYTELTEIGLWGIAGSVYFSIFRGWLDDDSFTPFDPTDASGYDAYRITGLGEDEFEYEGLTTGNHFRVVRVKDDFTFPVNK